MVALFIVAQMSVSLSPRHYLEMTFPLFGGQLWISDRQDNSQLAQIEDVGPEQPIAGDDAIWAVPSATAVTLRLCNAVHGVSILPWRQNFVVFMRVLLPVSTQPLD